MGVDIIGKYGIVWGMMNATDIEIKVKRITLYKVATLTSGNTTVDLGMLDKEEQKALAEVFRNAAEELEKE